MDENASVNNAGLNSLSGYSYQIKIFIYLVIFFNSIVNFCKNSTKKAKVFWKNADKYIDKGT